DIWVDVEPHLVPFRSAELRMHTELVGAWPAAHVQDHPPALRQLARHPALPSSTQAQHRSPFAACLID
ncbi:MAG TPA: hypothetical protein VFS37_14125, partial [Conexibacter sp.]|nr:hypothetical protein [Conexibacter sp.]